ncbi:zf-HC2 domain-containing protein [Sphingomonas sp. DT-51]|uniref:zf-HC2 domain-containing protein n=1 Tax=Sphingomonas sp. DT-51 TaxID=3396165 RepID=UPI003F19894A
MPDHSCDAALQLLPWHVTGTLDAADEQLVQHHLAGCATCRTELARERALAAAIRADAPAASGGQTIVAVPGGVALRPRARGWMRRLDTAHGRPVWRRVAVAQFAALLVLGTLLGLPSQRAVTYRALGDAPAAGSGNALVMFRPDTSEATLRHLLAAADARLVDGPTAAGAYVVQLPGDGTALTRLRAQPAVMLAEPIGRGNGGR